MGEVYGTLLLFFFKEPEERTEEILFHLAPSCGKLIFKTPAWDQICLSSTEQKVFCTLCMPFCAHCHAAREQSTCLVLGGGGNQNVWWCCVARSHQTKFLVIFGEGRWKKNFQSLLFLFENFMLPRNHIFSWRGGSQTQLQTDEHQRCYLLRHERATKKTAVWCDG